MLQKKKRPETTIKILTYFRNLGMILTILLCVLGFICGKASDSYKPINVGFGTIVDGKVVIHEKHENALGGNAEGVRLYRNLSWSCYAVAAGCFIGTVVIAINKKRIQSAEQIECIGLILEKRENRISVEFENGERKYFSVDPSVIVMAGDFGKMTFQSGILIAFQRISEG